MAFSLKAHLLMAMPSVIESPFEHSVIYVCEHQDEGAVGLIINKPLPYPVGFMFEQLNIESSSAKEQDRPLLLGGPLQPERGFVIHRPEGNWRSSLVLDDDVTITTSNDIIRDMAIDKGPKDALVALGFTAWGAGQLDEELEQQWLVCSESTSILYEVPFENRWEEAARSIGLDDMSQLVSTGPGHA